MGYFVGEMVNVLIEERRDNFLEMTLHHLVALYLFFGMYMLNIWEIGCVITFCIDIVHTPFSFTKFIVETHYSKSQAVAFVITMVIFFPTRNILLPYYIYILADEPMAELAAVSGFVQFFLCYLLSILALLNYYWFGMFILVARNKMRRGELVDEHDNISNSMKKKV